MYLYLQPCDTFSLCTFIFNLMLLFFMYLHLQHDTFSLCTCIFFLMILSLYVLVSLPDDGRMNDRHMYKIIINERTVFVRCVVWVRMILTN